MTSHAIYWQITAQCSELEGSLPAPHLGQVRGGLKNLSTYCSGILITGVCRLLGSLIHCAFYFFGGWSEYIKIWWRPCVFIFLRLWLKLSKHIISEDCTLCSIVIQSYSIYFGICLQLLNFCFCCHWLPKTNSFPWTQARGCHGNSKLRSQLCFGSLDSLAQER